MRLIHLGVIVGVAVIVFIISQILLEVYLEDDSWQVFIPLTRYDYENLFKEVTQPVVVWWAPLGGPTLPGLVQQCGQHACYFTNDREFRHHPQLKAFMFYGSSTKLLDLPLPRNGSSVLWALLHEESPRNNAPLSHLPVLSLFNFSSTFSRHSSFPLTTQYLSSLQVLTDPKFFVTTQKKSHIQKEERLAPVLYLQSDCSTPTDRDSYVVELAKHIPVDSYGECLHNKDLPPHLQSPHSLDTMMSDDLLHLVAKYKFMLAFENGICDDYVTEKLWRPLISGTVPVYIGSPTVSDWVPNNKSAVLGLDFGSPKALAEYLDYLNNHDDEYNRYLGHKLNGEVTNPLLTRVMKERAWDTDWTSEKGDFIEAFGCFVCEKAHNSPGPATVTADHYSCPMPVSILSNAPNSSNFWLDVWFHGRCEAEVIRTFVDSGVDKITLEEYEDVLTDLVIKRKCSYSD